MIGSARVVAVGLDAPFIDAVADGMLAGKAGPAPGAPAGLPFSVHHHLLTQVGALMSHAAAATTGGRFRRQCRVAIR